ncbi:MAG TPA: nucleotide exchange factor GrpE [Rhodothermales bacterium]
MSTKAKDHTAVDEEPLAGGAEVSADHESDEFFEQPSELDALRQEFAALEDRFLRQAADFQNFRRRAFEDRALALDAGRNQIALPILDVLDDLRRSLEAAGSASSDYGSKAFSTLHNGVKLVYEKFVSELDRLGIREMSVVGAAFDEALHEAILQQPAPEGVATGTVLAEVQKGYTIGDRVLRHARVVVAS